MSSPTNLTERISHLRDHKDGASFVQAGFSGKKAHPRESSKSMRERRFATDSFMLFAYSLLGVAILAQFFLIIWLDII